MFQDGASLILWKAAQWMLGHQIKLHSCFYRRSFVVIIDEEKHLLGQCASCVLRVATQTLMVLEYLKKNL